jgi:hypothetical protein
MKTLKISILVLFLAAFSVACQKSESIITLKNDTSLERIDEAIAISRADLDKQIGKISNNKVPMLVSENGEVVPSQVDDLDGDGKWDELFLLANLSANSSINLKLMLVTSEELPTFTQRSNVWLGKPIDGSPSQELLQVDRPKITRENHGQTKKFFQFEGPGWENDRLGFRNYFDERNGMDIFGKTTSQMVLQNVGIDEDYHALQDWGMDILKVGASLGAGSLALEIDGKLHRVAPGSEGSYELVTKGPLRSIFRFKFKNWTIEDNTYSVLHEISIYGGAWYYVSKVSVDGVKGNANLVTGITTIDLEDKQATFANYDNGIVSLSTHGQQAIEGENLGMAIMLCNESYKDFEYLDAEAEGINHTFMVRMGFGEKPVAFRFYSAWELSDTKFAEAEGFQDLLKYDAIRMGSPIQVEIK